MSKKRDWQIFWEIPDCPPFLTAEPARMFTQGMKDFAGLNFQDCILEYRNNKNIWYLDANEWSKLDKTIFDHIISDIRWGQKINTVVEKTCNPCFKYLDSMHNKSYTLMTDQQLYSSYKKFIDIYVPAHGSGHPAGVLEMHNQRLSGYLKKYLQQKIWTYDIVGSANNFFSLLISPTKEISAKKEIKSFYKIGTKIQSDTKLKKLFKTKSTKEIIIKLKNKEKNTWKIIKQHHTSWCWTVFNWEGPANSLENYIESWQGAVRENVNMRQAFIKIQKEDKQLKKEKITILRQLKIDHRHRTLLKIASDIMFLKSLRKDCMYKGAWASELMFKEIGRRLNLTTHEARFIFAFEMKSAIINKKINKKNLKARTREVILHQRSKKSDKILVGKMAYDFVKRLHVQPPDKNIREIKGQCAFPGTVTGKVKYINTPDMMHKMEQGDILVAYATQPNLLPAMKKAAAFVTDFGGITCHAAIVAREWKIPCIIGTGNASKILKDGEIIEVNADEGIISRK